jgi:glycosyltransferase involved in cell wall biosynthesis
VSVALHAVAVVVPIRDEVELLEDCLRGLRATMRDLTVVEPDLPVHVVLVLDSCTDGSSRIALASGFAVTEIAAGSVGVARGHGVATALARWPEYDRAGVWVANTDADSVVPDGWLRHHVERARAGVDVLVGTVRPRASDLSPSQMIAWRARRTPGRPNGHVHGANLGIRASSLIAAGGFAPVPEHEDVVLVDRAVGLGAVVEASDAAEVLTSGRLVGRTPGGYARHLRDTYAVRSVVGSSAMSRRS